MSWILLVLASALSGSLTKIFQKILLKGKQSDPFAFSFIFQLTVAGLFLAYALLTDSLHFPDLGSLVFNLAMMTLLYALGNVLTFKAFKLTEASEVSVIFASNTLWSVLAAVLMLGEKLSGIKVAGIILVILGLIVINYTKSEWNISRGHLFALLGALFFGVAFTNDVFIINRFESVPAYMIVAFAFPAFATLAFRPKSIKSVSHFFNRKIFIRLLICSFFYFLSALTIFEAYKSGGKASIISPISQSSLIFTVILSYIWLKERDKLWQKIVGTVLTFGGILLLI